jgi:hypothetical protein
MTMYRKDNDEIPKDSNLESVDFKDIVSEGARAVLDAQDLIKNIDGDSIRNYSWKQTNGTGVVNLSKDSSSFSFIAPYVTGNDSGTSLSFELTVGDKVYCKCYRQTHTKSYNISGRGCTRSVRSRSAARVS